MELDFLFHYYYFFLLLIPADFNFSCGLSRRGVILLPSSLTDTRPCLNIWIGIHERTTWGSQLRGCTLLCIPGLIVQQEGDPCVSLASGQPFICNGGNSSCFPRGSRPSARRRSNTIVGSVPLWRAAHMTPLQVARPQKRTTQPTLGYFVKRWLC